MSDFFHMGGYGLYVWGSYGVTLGFMAIEILMIKRRKNKINKQLVRSQKQMNRVNR